MSSYEKIYRNVNIMLIATALADKMATEQGIAPVAVKCWHYWVKTIIAINALMDSLEDASEEEKNLMVKKLEDLLK